VIISL